MEQVLRFNLGQATNGRVSNPIEPEGAANVRLGLRANLAQFSLLVLVNAFVGAMMGMERSILSPLAEREFHLAARTAILSFIVVFGVTKALTNYVAGRFSDRFGRKSVLVGGWLVAIPVPFLLMWAPSWAWILFANALLGVSQGLTWSTTVIMKVDLAGPKSRGLAMGLNEFAGYFALAGAALLTGALAAGTDSGRSPSTRVSCSSPPGSSFPPSSSAKPRGMPRSNRSCKAGRPGADTQGSVLEYQSLRSKPLERQPGRPGEQPERRDGMGTLSPDLCRRPHEPSEI
jgi:hypothetical protein